MRNEPGGGEAAREGASPEVVHKRDWEELRMRMRPPKFVVVALMLSGILLAAIAPAGAKPGATVALTHISPHLTKGFPCGLGNKSVLYSFTKFVNNQVPAFGSCTGDIYQTTPAPNNTAAFLGIGQATSGPYAGKKVYIQGTGKLQAAYKYEEPCQNVGGKKPLGGEAYGTITLTLSSARTIVNNTQVVNGPVKTIVTFWWSRVGVIAIVGLRSFKADIGNNLSYDVNEPKAVGLAVALFTETANQVLAGCAPGPVPPPGQIRITSATLGVST